MSEPTRKENLMAVEDFIAYYNSLIVSTLTDGILLQDDLGVAYGVPQVHGKPRISSMPYLYDIGEGNVDGHTPWSNIGHNPAMVATVRADIWGAGGIYAFPTAEIKIEVLSSSAGNEDVGTIIKTGTSDGGSTTTLTDTGADFTAATAVQVGDCVILDKSMNGGRTPEWGYVTTVAAQTLTLSNGFSEGGTGDARTYSVIDKNTAGKTGAHAVHIDYLDGDYAEKEEIIILNGNTAVDSVNTDIFRVNAFHVIATGSGNAPVGNLTLRADGAGATYSYIRATYNRDRSSAYTVPAGKTLYIAAMTLGYGYDSNQTQHGRMWVVANSDPDTGFVMGNLFQPFAEVIVANNSQHVDFPLPLKFLEKTDFKVTGVGTFAGTMTSVMRGWLET